MKGWTLDDFKKSEAAKRPENAHILETDAEKLAKKSKYGNKKVVYDGIRFDSKRECNRYQDLKIMQVAGQIRNLRLQVPFELVPKQKGMRAMKYVADFVYEQAPDWKTVVNDAKGKKTRTYIDKKKLMKQIHGIDILET